MSDKEQVKQNIATFGEDQPLSKQEMDTLLGVADRIIKKASLPCTACRYCTSHCPKELDIPTLLDLYNEHVLTGGGFLAPMHLMAMPKEKQPSACIACHSCEKVCPQQIKISDALADFTEKLGQ